MQIFFRKRLKKGSLLLQQASLYAYQQAFKKAIVHLSEGPWAPPGFWDRDNLSR